MRMPDAEYNRLYKVVRDWTGSKEGLQKLYDEIYYEYDDGADMLYRIDKYQTKWTMNTHQ